MSEEQENPLTVTELVQLGAVDSVFFSRTFFPKTVRQESPLFHRQIWDLLNSTARYVNIQVFRDGAKTTLLRLYTAQRISYNLSRTILYIGKSAGHAARSLRWLRKQVETNTAWASTFQLTPGDKWTDEEMQINHGVAGEKIWIIGMGVTGSVRGLNFDDYRPDLVIIDDVVNEENAATVEQREKISELVLGAIKEGLSPATESPLAKMVILQTPLDVDDISQQALKDPQFVSARFGCWTPETEDFPLEQRESIWAQRYPSETLRQEYLAAAARNRLSTFSREKECKLVTPESSAMKPGWLKYFGEGEEEPEPPAHEMWNILVIDPVPPPSESSLAKGLPKGDFEALSVVGRWKNKVYVQETVYKRGHDPNWTMAEFFRLAQKWNVRKVIVDAVAYQRTLAWLLREAMKRVGIYYVISEYTDKRSKELRIADGLTGVASNHQLFFRRNQVEATSQFLKFSLIKKIKHDDVLETIAIGASELQNTGLNVPGSGSPGEDWIEDLEYVGGCP